MLRLKVYVKHWRGDACNDVLGSAASHTKFNAATSVDVKIEGKLTKFVYVGAAGMAEVATAGCTTKN